MGVSYLLDTHVVLWLRGDPDQIAAPRRAELADPATTILISSASAMEIATKTRLGKLPVGGTVLATWSSWLEAAAASEVAITSEHAILAGSMVWEHRDPFDRLLVAQALTLGVPLVTVDAVMRTVPGLRVIDPRE